MMTLFFPFLQFFQEEKKRRKQTGGENERSRLLSNGWRRKLQDGQ